LNAIFERQQDLDANSMAAFTTAGPPSRAAFGDCWEHRLTVIDIRAGEPCIGYPRHIAGEYNTPPEDCGGLRGFYATLDALVDPKHPNHVEVIEWFEGYAPNAIDELPIKYAIGRVITARRNAAKNAS
jgi:hypothetical protein